jgi:hypothetical protein
VCSVRNPFVLEFDIAPFNANFPHMTRPSSIGHGVQFLNRHLSSQLFRTPESIEPLFQFLKMHTYRGQARALFTCYALSSGLTAFGGRKKCAPITCVQDVPVSPWDAFLVYT